VSAAQQQFRGVNRKTIVLRRQRQRL